MHLCIINKETCSPATGGVQPPVLQVRGAAALAAPHPAARGEGGALRGGGAARRLLPGHARHAAHGHLFISFYYI